MNADVKALWLQALRSGEYRKGRRRLRSADGARHCCLGVLCELALKDGVGVQPSEYQTYPGPAVYNWAGLRGSGRDLIPTLASRNDNSGGYDAAIRFIEAQL